MSLISIFIQKFQWSKNIEAMDPAGIYFRRINQNRAEVFLESGTRPRNSKFFKNQVRVPGITELRASPELRSLLYGGHLGRHLYSGYGRSRKPGAQLPECPVIPPGPPVHTTPHE